MGNWNNKHPAKITLLRLREANSSSTSNLKIINRNNAKPLIVKIM